MTARAEKITGYTCRPLRWVRGGDMPLPGIFAEAQTSARTDRLAKQAAVQKHADSVLSKTADLPTGIFRCIKVIYPMPATRAARTHIDQQ